jgi:hypothetical protein
LAIDAGATFVGGVLGNATWKPIQSILHNPTQKTVLFFSTQSWLNAGTQAASQIIKSRRDAK